MTQEEKFKEAKRLYETANADQKYVLESLFPELAETEDERIRKALIRYFTLSDEHAYNEACGVSYRDIVAWLESQGEQKPLGFNIGDEITVNGQICKVVAVEQKPDEWSSEQRKILQTDDVPNESSTAAPLRTGAIGFDGEPMKSKPCEQKPTEWTEEDEKMFKQFVNLIPQCMTAQGYNEYINWLKSIKNRIQPQQKQGWSEEDMEMIGNIRRIIEKYAFSQSAVDVNGDLCEKEYIDADNWLKNLKDRCVSKSKQEVSSDISIVIEDLRELLSNAGQSPDWVFNLRRDIDILNSLKHQNRWKPSDEQMDALRYVTNFDYGGYKAALVSLYEQLKKLREE